VVTCWVPELITNVLTKNNLFSLGWTHQLQRCVYPSELHRNFP